MSEYKTRDMKLRLSFFWSSYTWARGRRLYPVDLTLGRKLLLNRRVSVAIVGSCIAVSAW